MGFSLAKLLVLIAAILAVWIGFRVVQKRAVDAAVTRDRLRRKASEKRPTTEAPAKSLDAEEMSACRVCGAYGSPNSARSCGRSDCSFASA